MRMTLFTDENNEGRHVDKDLRSTVPEAVLNNLRNPYRHLQDTRHISSRYLAREYSNIFKVYLFSSFLSSAELRILNDERLLWTIDTNILHILHEINMHNKIGGHTRDV